MSRREIYSPPVHRPRCCFVWSRSASISRDRTASTRRPEASDHHAKVVSRISARTATFHFLRDSGDLPAQTGRSHARSERRSSLWEESLSLRPGQVGSIPSLNDQWAGDDFSLAGREKFEPSDATCCMQQFLHQISWLADFDRTRVRGSIELRRRPEPNP